MTISKDSKFDARDSSSSSEEDDSESDQEIDDEQSGDEVIEDDDDDDSSDDDDDSEDDEEPMHEDDVIVPSNDQQVNVEFEAFPPSDNDIQGLVALLSRLFYKEDINLIELSNWIVSHNYVGSVLKTNANEAAAQSEDSENDDNDDDDTVYGVTTAVSLKPTGKEDGFKKSIMRYLEKNCKREELLSVLKNSSKTVALLLTERFINIPPLLAPPMLKCLLKEIEAANKKKMPYNFTHFLLISKSFDVSMQDSQGLPPCLEFVNPEDEIFQEYADVVVSFPFPVAEDLVGGTWGPKDKPMPQYRTVCLLNSDKFKTAVTKIANVFTVQNMMALMNNSSSNS